MCRNHAIARNEDLSQSHRFACETGMIECYFWKFYYKVDKGSGGAAQNGKHAKVIAVWLRYNNWFKWLRIDWLPWNRIISIKIVTISTHIFHNIALFSYLFFSHSIFDPFCDDVFIFMRIFHWNQLDFFVVWCFNIDDIAATDILRLTATHYRISRPQGHR